MHAKYETCMLRVQKQYWSQEQTNRQNNKEYLCHLWNIAKHDYQGNGTTRQTDAYTDTGQSDPTMLCRQHKYNNHQIQGHNKLNSHKHKTYIRLWAASISTASQFTAGLACLTLRMTVWTHYITNRDLWFYGGNFPQTSQWPRFLLCNVHRNSYNLLGNSVYHQNSKRPGKGTFWKSP